MSKRMSMQRLPLWLTDKTEIRQAVLEAKRKGQRVGLIPTMGNLHAGHQSLIRQARSETDFVVATIFVNPIQFVQGEDFDSYPRTPGEDRVLCGEAGADVVFAPEVPLMYPEGFCTRVQVTGIEEPLCGHHRPGHFVGVATVIVKLFNLVPADVAYFGLKDFQQAKLISRLTLDLDIPMEIRLCETVREPDGLAMSSRNRYLSPTERSQATVLKRSLDIAERLVRGGERDPETVRRKLVDLITLESSGRIDYVELVDPETFQTPRALELPVLVALAVRFGKARLIDNTLIA
ncbi:MAG: pantoate--beta-alanine ligase [Planctomycetota bacterium]